MAGLGAVACSTPSPSSTPGESTTGTSGAEGPTPASTVVTSTSPEPPPDDTTSQRLWYEVDRSADLEGNLARVLLLGTFDGKLTARIPLAEQRPIERDDPANTFDLADPQAAGIFAGQVLIWGRDADGREIEWVGVETGRIQSIVSAADVVHSATANADGSRIFYLTADAAAATPTGLWQYDIGDPSPTRLQLDLGSEPIARDNPYRLAASADGGWLAVETRETIHILDVTTGAADTLHAPGPTVGFATEMLIAYGPRHPEGGRSLVAFSLPSMNGEVIASQVDAAQLASTPQGDVVAYMVIDPDTAGYQVHAVHLVAPDPIPIYEQTRPEPLMSLQDRAFLGESAPEWVLLGTSFLPAIEGERDVPISEESFPIVLNVVSRETERLGPFRENGS